MNLCISITDVINRLYASVYNYVCGSELNSEFIYISSRPLNLAEIRITCASMKQMVGRVVPKSVSAIPNVNLVRFNFQIVLKVTIQMLIQWMIKKKKTDSHLVHYQMVLRRWSPNLVWHRVWEDVDELEAVLLSGR